MADHSEIIFESMGCASNLMTATKVLYIPGLSANLLSVARMTKKGYNLVFDRNADFFIFILKKREAAVASAKTDAQGMPAKVVNTVQATQVLLKNLDSIDSLGFNQNILLKEVFELESG
ncbi:hypothetical protein FQA39_LY09013 [Lamprigera yunnana]|nr:hypothetical protein FQA39_LY09013 [Lamprigera yunnana]